MRVQAGKWNAGDAGRRLLMLTTTGLLVFTVEDVHLAVTLEQVERVVRVASLKDLPGSPRNVLGLLDLYGVPVPVVSLRRRLGLSEREIETTDEIIVLNREGALLGLLVDEVEDVVQIRELPPLAEAAGIKHLSAALKLDNEVVLVHNVDRLLSNDDELNLVLSLIKETRN